MKKKKFIRKRAKRAKNGTTMWKLTIMNIKTGKTSERRARGTYDQLTAKVHRVRAQNHYNAVLCEETHKWGGKVLNHGRTLALDSLFDEKLFEETIRRWNQEDGPSTENDDYMFPLGSL